MLLVSQDGFLAQFDDLEYVSINSQPYFLIDDKKEIKYYIETKLKSQDGPIYLAIYSSEERAKEVFNQMLAAYSHFEMFKLLPPEGMGQATLLKYFSTHNLKFNIFEFPEEWVNNEHYINFRW